VKLVCADPKLQQITTKRAENEWTTIFRIPIDLNASKPSLKAPEHFFSDEQHAIAGRSDPQTNPTATCPAFFGKGFGVLIRSRLSLSTTIDRAQHIRLRFPQSQS
jgi:hypothetical protein